MNYLKYLRAAAYLCTTGLFLLLLSFSSEVPAKKDLLLDQYLHEFKQATVDLDASATAYQQKKISIDLLRQELKRTRINYKKIEFFLAFHYPEYANKHFNGAPLLHIVRGTSPVVEPPEGLQALDELIFSDEAQQERVTIAALAKKLRAAYGALCISLSKQRPTNDMTITAMRMQLVRIFTLGITGFDTPGSLNALPEASASLTAMEAILANSEENVPQDIIGLFANAIHQLEAGDFTTLDRLAFLKESIDPLYKELAMLNKSTTGAMLSGISAWNPESKSIFAADFLDPYQFTELKKNEDSEQLRELGKLLFYDSSLSGNGQMSCASCHQPNKAFADGSIKSLSSIKGNTVLRNAPSLLNAVYADRYFYDLRAFTLEQQAEHVIFSTDEYATAYKELLQKLEQNPAYVKRFRSIFGNGKITRETFTKALASYVLSLQSFNSPFDQYARGELESISGQVKKGFNLFAGKANCATCHFAPTFAGLVPPLYMESESEILGVMANPETLKPHVDTDPGRIGNKIRSESAWIYEKSFKTTTVRNASQTSPYFHNGAYRTLEQVIDFYNEGGGEGMGHAVVNQTLSPDPLNLTDQEKLDLIAFIQSLDDTTAAKR